MTPSARWHSTFGQLNTATTYETGAGPRTTVQFGPSLTLMTCAQWGHLNEETLCMGSDLRRPPLS